MCARPPVDCLLVRWLRATDAPTPFVIGSFLAVDELYELRDDPYELTNLAADPRYTGELERLMSLIWERVKATGDTTLLNTHYYSMRFAVIGPNAALEAARL